MRRTPLAALLLFSVTAATSVQAQPPPHEPELPRRHRAQTPDVLDALSPDVEALIARSVDSLGRDQLGWGGGVAAHLELTVIRGLGLHLGAAFFMMSTDEQPTAAWWFGWRAGARWHWTALFDIPGDGWIDVHHELGRSGDVTRQGFDVGTGFSFLMPADVTVGPFFRMMYARDPVGDPSIILMFGASMSIFPRTRLYRVEPDEDLDGVPDHLDVCVEQPIGRYEDPERRGCPAEDSDGDGVVDPLDRCTHESMWPHRDRDPERHGCPAPDRDGDTVPDDWDMCPDTPAPDGGDPLREGCLEDDEPY